MKKLIFLSVAFSAIALLAFATVVSAQPEAICVPWQPSNPDIEHYTYSGAQTTLKGIARVGATEYYWDYGDGSPAMTWTPILNPYNLGVTHTYTGIPGQLIIATLYVRDGGGNEDQDQYPIMIYESTDLRNNNHLQVRINMAIDEGLWWLHTNMIRADYLGGEPGYGQPYGYWIDSYPVGATGTAVNAFELQGSRPNGSFDDNPYVETVQRGINYLLTHTYQFAIGLQSGNDPDTNGNGYGLVINQSNNLYDHRQTYIGGICATTLAESRSPALKAKVGYAGVYDRFYADIVQDLVDFWAWGQVDSGWGRGGWRYHANYSESDMSTAQWPPLAMLAAEDNMGSVVPQFVRDELILYLNVAQNTTLNNDNGGFAYYTATSTTWYNITKAAAGIICHEFLGTPLDDPRVQSAIGFIYRHWYDTGGCWDHTKLLGNSYGMYGAMKAFRIPEPDIAEVIEYDYLNSVQTENSFDWYYYPAGQLQEGMAHYTVQTQQLNGSWDDNVGCNQVYDSFATGWRILVLLKGVTIIPPVADICDCDEQEYNFNQDINLDASCSNHPDKNRSIVSYEWDLDNDGEFDDATGQTATIAGGFSVEGYYPVAVRVADDNPANLGGPQTSIYTCQVYVHPPPHCPHAFAGGPYNGWVNVPVTFDASASWDPDNEIVLYEWDIDNDGTFDYSGAEPTATHTWSAPYFGVVRLRVTDAEGEFEVCSDEDFTTVDIGNHTPVCDPNGPYQAGPGTTVNLDGSGSHDIDPGDVITCTWDLDNDGEFDDAFECEAEMAVPPDAEDGTVYDMCLKVTDSYSEYDIGCTTVTVVPNQPPVADPNGPYLAAANEPCPLDGTDSYDPDNDELDYSWDCGDGTDPEVGESPSHVYTGAGIYDACLTVNDGAVDSEEECTFAVVYDPGAGFVTGGGWIDSPAGAYEPDPELTGKANFGFVSKYKKGASTPTGNTEFQFHAADLNFHSDSYQWLIVNKSGDRAQYKGKGTINGLLDPNGNLYKFMLWAIDGDPDAFRIKIWVEEDTVEEEEQAIEIVVYDNGFAGSGYENGQPISGGSIVIHTKK